MSGGQQRHLARPELLLASVIHAHPETSRDMVLKVTSLAALGIYDRFYAGRPFPSRLQSSTSKRDSAQCHEFQFPLVERTLLVWGGQSFLLHLWHSGGNPRAIDPMTSSKNGNLPKN